VVSALIIAVLAALGLVVPTAAAHAHVGTVVAVTTTSDDVQHVGSVDATADSAVMRSARRRHPVRVVDAAARIVRALRRLAVTSWTVPARIVGGVPPGRGPPAPSTSFDGVAPIPA
jgi:hypothetical protein